MNDISPEEFELIEQYLNNEMTQQQADAFAKQLQTDELLQQKTNEVKLLLLSVNEAVLEEQLDKYHVLIPQKKEARVVLFNKKWWIAASILAFAFLSVWWLTNKENKYEKLYATYYAADPGLITEMGDSEDYAFQKGMVDYKERNYKKAIDAWSVLKNAKAQSDTLDYFLGVANLAIDEKEKAKELLTVVTNNQNRSFYKEACWYLGLIYLKEGEPEKAKALLERSQHPKSKDLISAIKTK